MSKKTRHTSNGGVNPTAVSAGDAAKLLTAALGRRVSADAVREAIAAGAPALPDGRVNLLDLAAWLEREVAAKR